MAHPTTSLAPSPWPHRLAVLTAGATVLLIFVGGLVTNTGSGLAVPDWPTTFGQNMFLYPWSQMVGGILYEHSHRLIGSVVGMLTVMCAVWLWFTEPRQWVRVLGVVAVGAVIVQGTLGGLRVVLLQHGLAIIHGCIAQAFFALMVGLAVCTSPGWRAAASLRDAARLRTLALVTMPLVYLQIIFGAWLTHTGSRLDAHLLGAALVVVVSCLLAGRVLRQHADHSELRRPAVLLLVLLALQVSLGLGAYLWRFTTLSESLSPTWGLAVLTIHRVIGAAVWGAAVVLSLRVLRAAGMTPDVAGAADRRFPGHLQTDRGHEVLA
jgi:cytochrome c oxidase assembly protein subunit 15